MALQTPPRSRDSGGATGGPRGPRRGRRMQLVAALAVGVLVVAGLIVAVVKLTADDNDPDEGLQTEQPVRSSEADKQAVVEAELGFFRTALDNNPPDPSHPALKRYATGRAYEAVVNAARENQSKGVILRLPPNSRSQHRPEVVSIDGDTAIVRACDVDDGLVVEQATGRVLNDKVLTRLYTVFMAREDGVWKVSATKVEQRWEGVAGCATA